MYLLFFVSRLRVESRTKTPTIYLRYKAASDGCEGVDFNEQLLNAFCFPLGPEAVQPKEVQASEEYTFTLTHNDGQRFTGFCRQIFPPAPRVGSKARYPQVLCIVAENPWCNFFFKVLQIAEQLLKGFDGLLDSAHQDLPLESHLGAFIVDLRKQLSTNPAPGEVLRLIVPNMHGLFGVSPPRYMGVNSTGESLNWANGCIELQVPPDCGNGKDNSGIPLARLLFHVPVEGMLTLIASLLLERRIVFVARSRDTVTAAVQAAQALIYPFRWHHIYLPILPRDLVDYLSAPMPFLVGLTSEMLPLIRHIPMSEVTMVDLDLQKVSPPPGPQPDDGRALPYGRQLASALEAVFKTVRSPTEYESSPLITGVMQEYFVRLFGSYRRYIHEQGSEPLSRLLPSTLGAGAALTSRGGRESARGYKEGREGRGSGLHDSTFSPQAPLSSSRLHDDMIRGHGYYFDQPAFVAHRRSEVVRAFLNAVRHSQLYQMFIQERLAMAASGAIELPFSIGSAAQSFSCTGAGLGGVRVRRNMYKSSSASNLTSLEKSSQGSSCGPASVHASDLSVLREGTDSTAGDGTGWSCGPGGGAARTQNPFEQRVERYPERRRLLREHLRSLIGETAAAGGAGAGGGTKLASKLRRHRRTDSEDMITQPAMLHSGESMRRITTYPGIVDVSTPTLDEPFSYFAEWDLHEDDDASASPTPSPRDREREQQPRSDSANNLQAMGDMLDASGVPPAAAGGAPSFSLGGRGDRTGRERDRDTTPQRRMSVPMLSTNAKSTYTALRDMPSSDSPGPGDRAPTAGAAAASAVAVAATAGPVAAAGPLVSAPRGPGVRVSTVRLPADGGGPSDPALAVTVLKGGVQVQTFSDGHRVYDGSFKDMLRMAAEDAKNGLLSSLSGLASPLSSPRAKDRNRAQLQHQRKLLAAFGAAMPMPPPQNFPDRSTAQLSAQLQQQPQPHPAQSPSVESGQIEDMPRLAPSGSIPLPGMEGPDGEGQGRDAAGSAGSAESRASAAASVPEDTKQQHQPLRAGVSSSTGNASTSGAGHHFSSFLAGSSFLSGLKDKVAGAGSKAKALGILPTPAYKPQTTGEKAAKFKAQLTGGGGATLLAGADGKLKQPHAPQRPLSLTGGLPPVQFLDRSAASEIGPPPHLMAPPSFTTPMASPSGLGMVSEVGGPVEVSPFAPRIMSTGGIQHFIPHQYTGGQAGSAAAAAPAAAGSGDATPPNTSTLAAPGSFWRSGAAYAPPPSDWDPFGTASAPPALPTVGVTLSAGAATGAPWTSGGVKVAMAAATSTSPFAAATHGPETTAGTSAVTPVSATVPVAAAAAPSSSCDATTADLLGLSPSGMSGFSSSCALPASSAATFDPFAASDQVAQGRLESAGSNDFAAFASASSPRDFPGIAPLGAAPVVG